MKYLLVLLFISFSASISYATSLSANPWEQENTQIQIDNAYKKRHRRFHKNENIDHINKSTSYQQQPQEEEKNVFDKLGSMFEKNPSSNTPQQVSKPIKRSKRRPKRISAPKRVAPTPAPLLDTPKQSETKDFFSMPEFNTPSMPKFNTPSLPDTNSLIRKFERSMGIDLKKMGRQFKGR